MNASGNFIVFFLSVFTSMVMDVCRRPWCVLSFFLATKKRHTFFILFHVMRISTVFCSCPFVHEQQTLATERPEIYQEFKRPMALECECAGASEKLRIHIFGCSSWRPWRVDRQTNDAFGYFDRAARSHVSRWRRRVRKCTHFSHLFLFVRLFTYFNLCVCPFDYLQCIKWVTKESPRGKEWDFMSPGTALGMQ